MDKNHIYFQRLWSSKLPQSLTKPKVGKEKKNCPEKHGIPSIFWGHPIFLYIKPQHFLPSQPLSPSPASSADLPSSGSAHPKPPASWPCLTCWGLRCQAVKPWKTSHQKACFFQSDSGDSGQFRPFWTILESSGRVQKSTREVRALCFFFKRCRLRLCAVFVVWFLKKKIRDVIVSSYFFGLTDTMQTCATQTRV